MILEDCIFCKIIKGELPSRKLIENDQVIGILDNNPATEGHSLIIPKRHVTYWNELNYWETAKVFNTAKKVAKQLKKAFKPDYICVFIRGGRIKHTHVVLFPSYDGDKLTGFPQSTLGTPKINLDNTLDKLKEK
jgi:histidine triad (HIT) family protein